MNFKERVLEWVKTKEPTARSIDAVDSWGTDWYGSTEAGYDQNFSVNITYVDSGGAKRYLDVRGEDMESLWKWVVQNWPEEE